MSGAVVAGVARDAHPSAPLSVGLSVVVRWAVHGLWSGAVRFGLMIWKGKGGIFSPGIPIGQVRKDNGKFFVSLFSELSQMTFVNIALSEKQMQNN